MVSPDGTLEVDLSGSIYDCGLGGDPAPTDASMHLRLSSKWIEATGCEASYVLRASGNISTVTVTVQATAAAPGWTQLDQHVRDNHDDLQLIVDSVRFSF